MKDQSKVRMPRSKNTKKDAADSNEKSSGRKQPKRNLKRNVPRDDDSVDSKGNIRDLIAYSEEDDREESSSYVTETETASEEELSPKKRGIIRRSARKAALKARKSIHDRLSSLEKNVKKLSPKNRRREDDTEEEEEEDSEEEIVVPAKKGKKVVSKKSKKLEEEEDEEEDEEDYDEEEDEDEEDEEEEDEDDEDEDDDEEDDEDEPRTSKLQINFGFGGGSDMSDRMIPKRHNMKKETAEVKKYVKLISQPFEENTIDDQIDQFKSLPAEKQTGILTALERKPQEKEQPLMFKILSMKLPAETQGMILSKYHSLQSLDPGSGEFFKLRNWLDKLTSLPFGMYKEIPVRIDDGQEKCGDFMKGARKYLEDAIYGQEEAKMQIMQFIATKISNPNSRGLSLLLAGPPGIGKTSLIKNGIAKALGWPFQFVSLGGDSDATTYTGHQLVYESSHAGKIVNSLINAKSMSMVLMFDEVDKISSTPKGEEVQNLLIHLTDPVQNEDFEDKYLSGVPIDLSKVMFVFSANDLGKIDKVLLDRMNVITLQGYNAKEKQAIAENFLLPQALKEVNLTEKVAISKEIVEHIIREYANEETGVRELKRCFEQIAQKINMLRMFNSKDLPFHIPDFHLPFVLKKDHIDLFLKKKAPAMDVSVQRMYS